MKAPNKLRLFLHRLFHWEYWSVWIIYLPCFLVYPYYALRCRSTLFFTVANPDIENSGAFLTSKYSIYRLLKPELIPATYLVNHNLDLDDFNHWMQINNLSYPLIIKPDYGLRGLGIKLIKNQEELISSLESIDQEYLIQEYVNYENEIGVFLIREKSGALRISSIVEREFITIIGNGVDTIEELILKEPRYAMQYQYLFSQIKERMSQVLESGAKLSFDKIGNHSRGTMFKNGQHMLTENLLDVMNQAMESIDFNYGRLDLKYKSLDDLQKGKDYKIIELNGVFSEPAHIYEPGYSLLKAWRSLLSHFNSLFTISNKAIQLGAKPDPLYVGLRKLFQHHRITRELNNI